MLSSSTPHYTLLSPSHESFHNSAYMPMSTELIRILTPSLQAIQQGHNDIAKIYAQNAIRKQNERLNLLRLGSRIDAVASRVQTAVTMRAVTGSMMNVVKGMDQAMKAMDLEKVYNSQACATLLPSLSPESPFIY